MKQIWTLLIIAAIVLSFAGDSTSLNTTREMENDFIKDDSFPHCPPDYSFYKLPVVEVFASKITKEVKVKEPKKYGEIAIDTSVRINSYIRQVVLHPTRDELWFGTYALGAGRYDGKKVHYLTMKDGLGGNIVRNIVTDRSNKIWFATNGGVSVYDGNNIITYKTTDGLCSNEVWGILEDKNSQPGKISMWFATEEGVCHYNGKTFTRLEIPAANLERHPDAYPAAKLVNCMYQDKKGNIWFGTNGGGVYRYDGGTVSAGKPALINLSEKTGLCNNFIQSINEDSSGNLWFCSRFGGVSKYDGKSFVTYSIKNGLSNNFVWSMFEEAPGKIWFATAGGGAVLYDGKTFKKHTSKDGLADNYVQSIIADRSGKLWFATGLGLSSFDGKKFTCFSRIMEGC